MCPQWAFYELIAQESFSERVVQFTELLVESKMILETNLENAKETPLLLESGLSTDFATNVSNRGDSSRKRITLFI